jgi:hypothetical protein
MSARSVLSSLRPLRSELRALRVKAFLFLPRYAQSNATDAPDS